MPYLSDINKKTLAENGAVVNEQGFNYFVSSSTGDDTATGDYNNPLETIDEAMNRINNLNLSTRGYGYVFLFGDTFDYSYIDLTKNIEVYIMALSETNKPTLYSPEIRIYNGKIEFSGIIFELDDIVDNVCDLRNCKFKLSNSNITGTKDADVYNFIKAYNSSIDLSTLSASFQTNINLTHIKNSTLVMSDIDMSDCGGICTAYQSFVDFSNKNVSTTIKVNNSYPILLLDNTSCSIDHVNIKGTQSTVTNIASVNNGSTLKLDYCLLDECSNHVLFFDNGSYGNLTYNNIYSGYTTGLYAQNGSFVYCLSNSFAYCNENTNPLLSDKPDFGNSGAWICDGYVSEPSSKYSVDNVDKFDIESELKKD